MFFHQIYFQAFLIDSSNFSRVKRGMRDVLTFLVFF